MLKVCIRLFPCHIKTRLDVLSDLLKSPGTIKFFQINSPTGFRAKIICMSASLPLMGPVLSLLQAFVDDIVLFFIYLSHFLPLVLIGSIFSAGSP